MSVNLLIVIWLSVDLPSIIQLRVILIKGTQLNAL